MSFVCRHHLCRGLFWGIATILLLFCGQNTSARALALSESAPRPLAATAVLSPLPLQVPFQIPSDHWEASGMAAPQHAALSRDRLSFSPFPGIARMARPLRFRVLAAFPRENHRILHPLEIRGMLPFPLAPPVLPS